MTHDINLNSSSKVWNQSLNESEIEIPIFDDITDNITDINIDGIRPI